MIYLIYLICYEGSPIYVGRTTKSLSVRLSGHYGSARNGSPYPFHLFLNSVSSGITIHELDCAATKAEAKILEQIYTNFFDGLLNVYCGDVMPASSRLKSSISNKKTKSTVASRKNVSLKLRCQFSEDQVASIIADPRSQYVIADEYGVTQGTISRIKRGVWAPCANL